MFTPLRIKTGYSFLKSALTVEGAVKCAIKNKYESAGIIDENVLFGLPKFFHYLNNAKIKPIGGMEIKLDDTFNLALIIKNESGYLNLCKISSSISNETFNYEFLKSHSEGLIGVLTSENDNFKNQIKINDLTFRKKLNEISKLFSTFFIGLEIISKEDKKFANSLRDFSNEYGYNLVCFPRILYEKKEDAIALKILTAIENNETLNIKKEEGYQYFLSEKQYLSLYTQDEINKTGEIAKQIDFNLFKKRGELICLFDKDKANEVLFKKCQDRLIKLNLNDFEHQNRLKKEINCISALNFSNYFLVVSDYVNYAKTNDILVGPGRGSAVGSLVSYLLNITDIDPLQYDLQFERFLNINRKSMPDIDVDFQDNKRELVVQYLRDKYGKDRVSNVITFQTILAKQALRDIGRVFNYKSQHIDYLSKLLVNKDYSLRESYKKIDSFKKIIDSDKYFLEIVSLASKIEFLPRQNGIHAAGIILNNTDIFNSLPLIYDFEGNSISQYEKDYLEEQGFLKMDILGLRNLSVISNTVDLINKNGGHLDKFNLPYDDENVYKLINSLQTMGIFQLESSGMKRAIKTLQPSSFMDIASLLALFRPGPMKFIKTYAERKNSKVKINYISKDMETILSPTYGIIVYQEQINSIAMKMAAFSSTDADSFRKAISKKDKEVMHKLKKSFIDGAIKNGYTSLQAEETFDMIDRFSNYGFNKSHAVAYAKLALEIAYLKYYYPKEFYVSILKNASSSSDTKFTDYLTEMQKRNIKIINPSINKSSKDFKIQDNSLLFPLTEIRGINDLFVDNILKEREENGLFKDFYSFVLRMSKYKISESQILALINSGALDEFSTSRESLRMSTKVALQRAKLLTNANGQIDIGLEFLPPKLIKANDDEIENINLEYDVLGVMLSNNPLKYKKDLLKANKVSNIIDTIENGKIYRIAGIVRQIKIINAKNGKPMAFVKLFDESGEKELVIFPSIFINAQPILSKNNILLVEGKNEIKDGNSSFIVDNVKLLEE